MPNPNLRQARRDARRNVGLRRGPDARRSLCTPCTTEALERRLVLSGYVLGTITPYSTAPNGSGPQCTLARDPAGNLFGTASSGGAYNQGTIFEIPAGTGSVTVLASFHGFDGGNPLAGVTLDASGNLFGTTKAGGAAGLGTVFELAKGGHRVTTLASFNGANGSAPLTNVVFDSAGSLFGTTSTGGAANLGTVFEIAAGAPAGTATLATLASFNGANGSGPSGAIALDASGNLFGATAAGGAGAPANPGAVFELPKGGNTITAIGSFNGANGSAPLGGVTLDPSGNLFGTADLGGIANQGTLFEVAAGTNSVTALASFGAGSQVTGQSPHDAPTLDASGNLYGTTNRGGPVFEGTIFEFTKGTSTLTTLASFNGSNGGLPLGGVTLDSTGNLFGTTSTGVGGVRPGGTVYELPAGSSTPVALATFFMPDPSPPDSGLALDSFGNLWGTTQAGGTNSDGSIFEIAKGTSVVTQVASFDHLSGSLPSGGVVFDSAGNLYGAAAYDGDTNSDGTVYELPQGSHTVTALARFNHSNGSNPLGGVVIDSSGNLFGTTTAGGANGVGNIFEVAKGTGAITVLASFTGPNGSVPVPTGGMALDASGNLFGTTAFGGDAKDDGAVFELAQGSHTITTLAQFNGANGSNPITRVVLDPAGNLFGTADKGGDAPGDAGDGTIFEVASGTKAITALALFGGANGANPTGNLVRDASGNLFGTTEAGGDATGAAGDGTVYEFPAGASGTSSLTTLAQFNGTAGAKPEGDLALDSAGNLYGATQAGGTIFQLYKPAQLTFLQPPSDGFAGQPLTPAVTVAVRDSGGNIVRADASTVTLTLTGGTFADGSATATATALNGVATFPTLVINAPGSYSLTASDAAYSFTTSPAPVTVADGSLPAVQSAGVSDGSTTAGQAQRSEVRWLTVTFASPVTLIASEFSLSLLNTGGSGANDGSAPTPLSGVLGTPSAVDSSNTTWIVPVLRNTTASDSTGSLNDGIYTLRIAGTSGSPYTFTFHRLFGDTDGNETVSALDYARFKAAFGSSVGNTAYNADLDYDKSGTINALDYAQFKNRFGKTFTYP